MKRYTIGALFTPDYKMIALVQKEKPDWQKGKWNFPGGKTEHGEIPEECIAREFLEETGLNTSPLEWKLIGGIENEANYFVDFLTAVYKKDRGHLRQMTDEKVEWHFVNNLPDNLISNLKWLIPFAINIHLQGNADELKFGKFDYSY